MRAKRRASKVVPMYQIDTPFAVRSIESSSIALRAAYFCASAKKCEWARKKLIDATLAHRETLGRLLLVEPLFMPLQIAGMGFAVGNCTQAAKERLSRNSTRWKSLARTWLALQKTCARFAAQSVHPSPMRLRKAFALFLLCSSFALFFSTRALRPSHFLAKNPPLWEGKASPLHFDSLKSVLGAKGTGGGAAI